MFWVQFKKVIDKLKRIQKQIQCEKTEGTGYFQHRKNLNKMTMLAKVYLKERGRDTLYSRDRTCRNSFKLQEGKLT